MSAWAMFLLWVLIGGLAGMAHLLHLRHLVLGTVGLSDGAARKKLTRLAPFRILAFVPVLLGAAYLGLPACLGVITGIVAGRTVGAMRLRPDAPAD